MPELGQTISHYRIAEKIGQGGMGEVYLADDTTLDRKVALKFLPEVFTSDPERMARFEREAKLLASLNHPNIAGIYGLEQADGIRFLVLEYVEGETLQARLRKAVLPLEEALAICRQIAEGLEAAHEKGVIHRDLKPANVMITAEEKVKILDFGLAKALVDETQSIDPSDSPTITEAMTRPGVVLGTAAYMSPEQAKGKSVDKRADIWAFGCILYECLTGKRAFKGETVTETLAAILRGEPDIEKAPAKTRLLLRKCLVKDRKNRLRDIGDAMTLIESGPHAVESMPVGRPWFAWSVAALALLVALALAFLYFQGQERKEVRRFHQVTTPMPINNSCAISPDGRWIAYVASSSESTQSLFVCGTGSITSRKLDGTEGARYLFWSPDSGSIGFFTGSKLKRVAVTGESPTDICDVSDPVDNGTWNDEGVIVFSDIPVLRSVPATGGKPVTIISHEEFPDTAGYGSPYFLPDGRHYLFATWHGQNSKNGIYMGSLDPDEKIRIKDYCSEAVYTEPGYLLFQRERKLFAQAFNSKQQKLEGKEFSIADNLVIKSGLSYLSVSKNGLLVYRSASNKTQTQFTWFDRSGTELGPAGKPGEYQSMWDLSRDGNKIIFVQADPANLSQPDIWQFEWKRDILTLLTFKTTAALWPVWSPDGDRFAYTPVIAGRYGILEKKIGDPGEGNPVINSADDEMMRDWSKDGRYIAYTFNDGTSRDLYIYPLSGDRKPRPAVQRPFNQDDPEFSYDGKWLAYSSDESRTWQIYVIPISTEEQQPFQISAEGGTQPQWKGDDKEIFYLSLDGKMMAVDIDLGSEMKRGKSKALFNTGLIVESGGGNDQYAVTPDGQRFLLLKPVTESAQIPITVVLNWTSLLEP